MNEQKWQVVCQDEEWVTVVEANLTREQAEAIKRAEESALVKETGTEGDFWIERMPPDSVWVVTYEALDSRASQIDTVASVWVHPTEESAKTHCEVQAELSGYVYNEEAGVWWDEQGTEFIYYTEKSTDGDF